MSQLTPEQIVYFLSLPLQGYENIITSIAQHCVGSDFRRIDTSDPKYAYRYVDKCQEMWSLCKKAGIKAEDLMELVTSAHESRPEEVIEAQKFIIEFGKDLYANFRRKHAVKLEFRVFSRPGAEGDFSWMIEQPDYLNTLFVFNDNEEQFLHGPNTRGGGNAVIRPYKDMKRPHSWGVPTGDSRGGYSELTPRVAHLVDRAVEEIYALCQQYGYTTVIYSAQNASGALGTGIFQVNQQVKDHIVATLRRGIN